VKIAVLRKGRASLASIWAAAHRKSWTAKLRQWNNLFYRTIKANGISKEKCGAFSHGFRYAHAQERYRQLTGFAAPVKFASKAAFRANACENHEEKMIVWTMLEMGLRVFDSGTWWPIRPGIFTKNRGGSNNWCVSKAVIFSSR